MIPLRQGSTVGRRAARRSVSGIAGLDERFMTRALELAARGMGRTHPNPAVGAVLVKNGRVVGQGFHRRAGGPHAEVVALRKAGRRAVGSTLYVTLEPCPHYGRTPPCVDAVLAAGVVRVVIGVLDPNPRVSRKGVRRLRRAGVAVSVGVCGAACRELLAGYFKWIRTGQPLVVLKLASSLDGRIATVSGKSRWITGTEARRRAHQLRDRLDAVMVGAGTVLTDDPRLTCRLRGGRDPIRIVIDGRLRVSPQARLLRQRSPAPTWFFTARGTSRRRVAALTRANAEVIALPGDCTIDLRKVLKEVGRRGVTTVLLEGGATLAAAALRAHLVDHLVLFLAPMLIGGDGVPAVGSLAIRRPSRGIRLQQPRCDRAGRDLVVEATLPLSAFAL